LARRVVGGQVSYMAAVAQKVTERQNELTAGLDSADPLGMVRLLRSSDAQLFGGYGGFSGLMDPPTLDALERFSAHVAAGLARSLSGGGELHVVMCGSGTSGRTSFVVSRSLNQLLGAVRRAAGRAEHPLGNFHYNNSGGDKALLRAAESAEDSLPLATQDLGALEAALQLRSEDRIALVGISCGFSATYVGAQLEHAMDNPQRYSAVLVLGFNPPPCMREVRVAGWGNTFQGVLRRMREEAQRGAGAAEAQAQAQLRVVLDPTVGPEPVAGSTRMKGGSATKMLLETILCNAAVAAVEQVAPPPSAVSSEALLPPGAALLHEFEIAVRRTYAPAPAASLASLASAAADALKRGGRLVYLGAGPAGVLGIIDASECPPTFGAAFTDIGGFVAGGWAAMEAAEGDVGSAQREPGEQHSLQLSIEYFEAEVLPLLGERDVVVLLELLPDGEGGPGKAAALHAAAAVAVAGRAAEHGARLGSIRVGSAAALAAAEEADGGLGPGGLPVLAAARICVPSAAPAGLRARLRACGGSAVPDAALAALPPIVAEIALKIALNAVSTCAHVLKGAVFSNCMINLRITNIKLFHRAAGLVAKLGAVSAAEAQLCVLRAIYAEDAVTAAGRMPVSDASVPEHVAAAAEQECLLPLSLLLALSQAQPELSVAEAKGMIVAQPVLRRLLLPRTPKT